MSDSSEDVKQNQLSKTTSKNSKVVKKINSFKSIVQEIKNSEDKTKNSIKLIYNFNIELPISSFGYNFRERLIQFLKENYLHHSYYIVYIDEIDFEEIKNFELPLVHPKEEYYKLVLPLTTKFVYFNIGDEVELNLLLTSDKDNKINVSAVNNYIYCTLNLESQQNVIFNNNVIVLIDKKTQKTYKNDDVINVKLTDVHYTQDEKFFNLRLNYEGKMM